MRGTEKKGRVKMTKEAFTNLIDFFKAYAMDDAEKANSIKFADRLEDNEISEDMRIFDDGSEEDSNGKP